MGELSELNLFAGNLFAGNLFDESYDALPQYRPLSL
jgi:hypothetical protein